MKRHKMSSDFLKTNNFSLPLLLQLFNRIIKEHLFRFRTFTLPHSRYSSKKFYQSDSYCHQSNCHRVFNQTSNRNIHSSYNSTRLRQWWAYLLVVTIVIGGDSKRSMVQALRCYCNPHECDVIRSQDCPGKGFTVWDPCKCCHMCARTLGEACGGPGGFSGTCEPPLQCVAKLPLVDGLGVCMELPESISTTILNCTNEETIVVNPGCEITNNKCQCWPVIKMCKENRPTSGRWHFRTLQDCQLNLRNLIKTQMEFDEDFTVSPRSFTYRKVRGKRRRIRRRRLADGGQKSRTQYQAHSRHIGNSTAHMSTAMRSAV